MAYCVSSPSSSTTWATSIDSELTEEDAGTSSSTMDQPYSPRRAAQRQEVASGCSNPKKSVLSDLLTVISGRFERSKSNVKELLKDVRQQPSSSSGLVDKTLEGAAASMQQEYVKVSESYRNIKLARLRARLSSARSNGSYKKARQLLHSGNSFSTSTSSSSNHGRGVHLHQKHHHVHIGAHKQAAGRTPAPPSLPALTVVVKMLLQLAAVQASPAVAQQLRQQLLQQVKTAAAASRQAQQPFSVAAAVRDALPHLRTAVRQAVSQAQVAAAAAAAASPAAAATDEPNISLRDPAAAVEAALTAAACEVQLCSLHLSPSSGSNSLGSSMEVDQPIDMEALLQAEMASVLSAAL